MTRWIKNRNRWITAGVFITALALSSLAISFKMADNDYFFKLNKELDIFGRVYKEVTMNYVDSVDPEKFMESGIEGMLGSLDPYTNFISEADGDEIELITNGTYGGIGVTIGTRDNYITIISLMDGYSAQRQGVIPGDKLVEIDGQNVVGMKPDAVRALTRGEPGSELHMKVLRDGEKDTLAFTLIREEIQLRNVTYANYIDTGIAYIRLEHFSRNAGNEVRLAIQDLRSRGSIKAVVLDLRNNPGGLLDAAVDVVEKFVPRGSLIVSTRGRVPETEKKYYSNEEPMLPNTPLIVLVNHNSASASEIVAGAIQDLDRGVILGSRSFGKGLVQTITPLSYNTQLKITTAKYYTPSGRCIQEIDYQRKDNDGSFAITADSMRHEFRTLAGRPVYERGGITPDSVVNEPEQSALDKELLRKLMYFRFATSYAANHRNHTAPFVASTEVVDEFQDFLTKENFTYLDDGEKKAQELRQITDNGKYTKEIRDEVARLEKDLAAEKTNAVQKHYAEIKHELTTEIASRFGGEKGRIAAELRDDPQLEAAKSILDRAAVSYGELLTYKKRDK